MEYSTSFLANLVVKIYATEYPLVFLSLQVGKFVKD